MRPVWSCMMDACMSMTEPIDTMPEPWDNRHSGSPRLSVQPTPTPIVPSGSIAGRSLTAVVAIMTFLAAVTAGGVMMVVGAATDWQSEVGREVTIQVRPVAGRDIEADVRMAGDVARASAGIADVRAYTKQESEKLLEPWLGTGLALGELPIPRMIVVKLAPGATPDFTALRQKLAARVPSASLDDHRGWIDRMRTMADTAIVAGIAILVLVVAVTVLSSARPQRRRHRRRRRDHHVRHPGTGQCLVGGHAGRRGDGGPVRRLFHRNWGLSRHVQPDLANGRRDGVGLAPHRQSYTREYRLRGSNNFKLPPKSEL
jgi:hypothetical protein